MGAITPVVEAPIIEALSAQEVEDLARLVKIVDKNIKGYVAAGNALAEIRDRRLYRAEHETFEAFCRERWGIERAHAYRLMDAAKVAENVSPVGDIPSSERQARELARLDPPQQREAWSRAKATAPDGKPTAKQVRAAVKAVNGSTPSSVAMASEPSSQPPSSSEGDDDQSWLDSCPVRAQLADKGKFDELALTWRRIKPLVEQARNVCEAWKAAGFNVLKYQVRDNLLQEMAKARSPKSWSFCEDCRGEGCWRCNHRGFLVNKPRKQ